MQPGSIEPRCTILHGNCFDYYLMIIHHGSGCRLWQKRLESEGGYDPPYFRQKKGNLIIGCMNEIETPKLCEIVNRSKKSETLIVDRLGVVVFAEITQILRRRLPNQLSFINH